MEYYDNLGAFVDMALNTPRADTYQNSSETTGTDGGKWSPQNWKDTLEAYRTGWPQGLDMLENARRSLLASLMATQHVAVSRYDVAGYRPHVARAAAGEPLNMVARGEQTGRKRIIKLTCNIVANMSVSAANMANRGAAVAALVDDLETRGSRVELVAQIGVNGWPSSTQDKQSVSITIKSAQEHLDLDRLAFVFINTGFFRRIWFRYAETFKECPSMYGTASDKPTKDGLFVPCLQHNGQSATVTQAAQELADIVKAYEQAQAA